MSEYNENNHVEICGKIVTEPTLSHEVYAEKFYIFTLQVMRLSDTADFINVLISERLFTPELDLKEGMSVKITGQFRSYNNYTGDGNRLVLTVFTKEIECYEPVGSDNPNCITLDGYICKLPTYRVTPFGREIADILIAVNRSYSKSDYIPAIAWGRNARFCRDAPVGTRVKITGRIQSREYVKHIDEETQVKKTAFEVSVSKMEFLFED